MGSDGCNRLGGTYTVAADGPLNATTGPTTLIGCCQRAPTTIVLEAATHDPWSMGSPLSLVDLSGAVHGPVRAGSR